MRRGRQGWERSGLRPLALAAACGVGFALPLTAEPVGRIDTGGALPESFAVLDIRAEKSCLASAPAEARCLPAMQLLSGAAGAPVGFHALRWALGALGLTGAETLVVYPGDEVALDDAFAVAGLAHLTGQAEVLVHTGQMAMADRGGQTRGMWRQVIFTAPMRTEAMKVDAAAGGALRDRLSDYAMGGGTVAFAPET